MEQAETSKTQEAYINSEVCHSTRGTQIRLQRNLPFQKPLRPPPFVCAVVYRPPPCRKFRKDILVFPFSRFDWGRGALCGAAVRNSDFLLLVYMVEADTTAEAHYEGFRRGEEI